MFFYRWYKFSLGGISIKRNAFPRALLCVLPALCFAIILYTLSTLASYDVVNAPGYIFFYLLIGFSWVYLSMFLMFFFFDVSWIDDALNMSNSAAALAVAGGGLGITLIYAGANIGDGPGWWCVFFAGGLGVAAWVALGKVVGSATKVFRRIAVGRDTYCGARTCAYLLSSGIILGRASAGDWTSFSQTVVEFGDGWPVLVLAAVFVLFEKLIPNMFKNDDPGGKSSIRVLSFTLGVFYVAASIYAVLSLPPLPVNPIYRG
jgi:hypothetical protein